MPWPLTVISCLSAGIVIGFFACSCVGDALIADAELRAFNAQAEADHQKDLADKWKRVAHPTVVDRVANIEAGRILREQRRQQGGFSY